MGAMELATCSRTALSKTLPARLEFALMVE
jgi:hypothetical protein